MGRLGQRSARAEAPLTPLDWALLALLSGLVLGGLFLLVGIRRIERLADLPPLTAAAPLVSLIVAARNEERNVEVGARSLGLESWPEVEIDLGHRCLSGVALQHVPAALVAGCGADVVLT